ncbi:hypothetical protein HHK36_000093 [Tetracentron sinense]|uniref:WRKY domain-containing protein n=1 Tax=Tetracentron sinense TaxID=13715 RepID=A0A834ZTJ0_TETSI|nr:hypothetical protein HHK36_000093 [Tetracentron sinense]
MENAGDWEKKTLINELIQGRELVRQLQIHLDPPSTHEMRELLIEKILCSYEKAISMLKPTALGISGAMLESPNSVNGSPLSADSGKDQDQKDVSKKRKTLPRWTEQVRVCLGAGLEGPLDDGYNWRKYGQKDILGAKYPRGYFRCTRRNVQGCLATKQVQRSDEDPSIFEITYRGKHTCIQVSHLIPAMASAREQEPKQINDHHHEQQKQQQSQEILLNFRTGLKVKTDLDTQEHTFPSFSFPSTSTECLKTENHIFPPSTFENNFMGSISPSFISPATSESNYFSVSPCRMHSYGGGHNLQTSESDLTEIISAATSVTNSPILDLDFPLDAVEFDPNFPFDNPGFFT